MSSPPLADLLSRTATHETGAWLIAVSLGAGLSAIPLLARRWLRPDLPRLALALVAGVAGASAGAALLPLLLRLPSLAATGDLGAWLYGDRMAIGALLGFALCAFLVARRLDLDPWRALDTLSPSMGVLVLAGRTGWLPRRL
ncbi:MAG: hypothetical protein R3F14_32360 [Polyangiaceae bacterium]